MAVVSKDDVPKKVLDLYNKGYSALERGNVDFAIELFSSALDLQPGFLEARRYLRLAEVKQAKENKVNHQMSSLKGTFTKAGLKSALKKDPAKALVAGEKLMRLDALNPDFAMAYAEAAFAADLPEAAAQTLEIVKDHHPENLNLHQTLADLYLELREPVKAREVYEHMLTVKPNDQNIQKSMRDAAARETVHRGSWETKEDYRTILKDEKQAGELEQEQRSKKSTGDLDKMIEGARKRVESDPDNVNYRRGLSDLLLQAERYDEALDVLEKARELAGGSDPQIDLAISRTTEQIYDYNIRVLRENGEEEQAKQMEAEREQFKLEDSATKVKRYPNDLRLKFEYGEMLFARGEINDAVQQFQRSQTNPERRIESLYYLGRCFLAKEQYDIAIEQLEKANKELLIMDDNKKRVLYELGLAAEKMGDKPRALEYYKDIYAVEIGYRDVSDKVEGGLKD